MTILRCTKCDKDKDETEFPLNGDGRGGRRKQCKQCMRDIDKSWRKTNKDKVKDYNKNRKPIVPPPATAE